MGVKSPPSTRRLQEPASHVVTSQQHASEYDGQFAVAPAAAQRVPVARQGRRAGDPGPQPAVAGGACRACCCCGGGSGAGSAATATAAVAQSRGRAEEVDSLCGPPPAEPAKDERRAAAPAAGGVPLARPGGVRERLGRDLCRLPQDPPHGPHEVGVAVGGDHSAAGAGGGRFGGSAGIPRSSGRVVAQREVQPQFGAVVARLPPGLAGGSQGEQLREVGREGRKAYGGRVVYCGVTRRFRSQAKRSRTDRWSSSFSSTSNTSGGRCESPGTSSMLALRPAGSGGGIGSGPEAVCSSRAGRTLVHGRYSSK